MINKLMSRANTNELSGTANMVISHVNQSGFNNKRLPVFSEKLKVNNEELIKAQKRKRKSDKTVIVNNLEDGRDDGFKSFSYATKATTFRANKNIAKDAKLIYEVIERHGLSLYSLPNMEQTAVTLSLISELDKPVYQAALQNTGLDASYVEMKATNQAYIDGDADRTKSESEKEDSELVAVAYKSTKTALDHLINYLNSLSFIEESVELNNLSESLASIIDKANAKIHTRINRGKGNGETEVE